MLPLLSTSLSPASAPTLILDTGIAKGEHLSLHHGIRAFKGLPFAEPPVGDLRWQPPRPPKPWAPDVREATSYGKTCVQPPGAWTDFSKVSEDCLYLNAWLPRDAPPANSSGFPTLVFFYGGSWKYGSAMFPVYSGDELSSHHNVITIAANYRLGAFGFLGSDRLRATDGSTGSFGIQDQRAALRWVHRNAKALGVDTRRLMIFGESAGAGSVANHMVRPRSWGLFTRAGMESGPMAGWTSQSIGDATATFDAFASGLGCGGPTVGSAAVQRCLRALPFENISTFCRQTKLPLPSTGLGLINWIPVVDGVDLVDHTTTLASSGRIAPRVPILLGSNMCA